MAAGRGTRMGPDVDKLFLDVAGAPVIWHTCRRLDHCSSVDSIVVVIREGMHSTFEELAHALDPRKPWVLAVGGKERQDSVWNGLMAVDPKTRLVAVQDGARPCTDHDLIQRCFSAASRVGASVAAQRCTDTVKESEGGTRIARHLDRTRLWTVQIGRAHV